MKRRELAPETWIDRHNRWTQQVGAFVVLAVIGWGVWLYLTEKPAQKAPPEPPAKTETASPKG